MLASRRTSRINDAEIRAKPELERLYSPLRTAIEKSIYTGQPSEMTKSLAAGRRSTVSEHFMPFSPSKMAQIKQQIRVPIDAKLIPTNNFHKISNLRFKILDVTEQIGAPIKQQDLQKKLRSGVSTVVYELKDQSVDDNVEHNIYNPTESETQIKDKAEPVSSSIYYSQPPTTARSNYIIPQPTPISPNWVSAKSQGSKPIRGDYSISPDFFSKNKPSSPDSLYRVTELDATKSESYPFVPIVQRKINPPDFRYNVYSSLDEAANNKCKPGTCCIGNQVVPRTEYTAPSWSRS